MFEPILDARVPNWKLRIALVILLVSLCAGFVWVWRMTQMPLRSYSGPLQPMSQDESQLASRLSAHVNYLSETVGERSMSRPNSLRIVTQYLRDNLKQADYDSTEHTYSIEGQTVSTVEAILAGSDAASGQVVVGAHYDSVAGTVGADDNATGVAAALELARLLRGSNPRQAVRLVFFVNEEPPHFQTEAMGSLVYARQLRRDGIPVTAMISLEMLGFYSDAPGSQKYPPFVRLFYPNRGDFIGFVGNEESRDLVRRSIRIFRETASFPSECMVAPANWPGVGWSDQWSFWQEHYPAIMITDTAMFRNPNYHTPRYPAIL